MTPHKRIAQALEELRELAGDVHPKGLRRYDAAISMIADAAQVLVLREAVIERAQNDMEDAIAQMRASMSLQDVDNG